MFEYIIARRQGYFNRSQTLSLSICLSQLVQTNTISASVALIPWKANFLQHGGSKNGIGMFYLLLLDKPGAHFRNDTQRNS